MGLYPIWMDKNNKIQYKVLDEMKRIVAFLDLLISM
jgi:hypothetical protein